MTILTKCSGFWCRYAQYGDVSSKVDVYAFGVVLYELISGKEAIVKTNDPESESKGLVALVVFPCFSSFNNSCNSSLIYFFTKFWTCYINCSLKKFLVSQIQKKIFVNLLTLDLVTTTLLTLYLR